jgi:Zn-dependent protease
MGGILALVFKMFKSGKALMALGTFLIYGEIFSWQFAAVLIATLVFHEYGHIRAMKRCGIPTKGIYLIPFVGGAAVAERAFHSRWEEVYVAMMGPTYGLVMVLACFAVHAVTGNDFFAHVAVFGALINAFNLLPINPLDGGRVAKSLAFSAGGGFGIALFLVGMLAGAYFLFVAGIGLFALIMLVSALEFSAEWKRHRRAPIPRLSGLEAAASILWILLLAGGFFTVMIWATANGIEGGAHAFAVLG